MNSAQASSTALLPDNSRLAVLGQAARRKAGHQEKSRPLLGQATGKSPGPLVGQSGPAYKHSYFPRTIRDWNELPQHIINANTTDTFKKTNTNTPQITTIKHYCTTHTHTHKHIHTCVHATLSYPPLPPTTTFMRDMRRPAPYALPIERERERERRDLAIATIGDSGLELAVW